MRNLIRDCRKIYSINKVYFNVFIFFCSLFALTNSGVDSSEGEFHYQVAVQIIKYGQLGFDTLQPGIFVVAPNGRTYGAHEIGNTLFMLPTALVNILLGNTFSSFVSQEHIYRMQEFILSFQASIYSALTATTFFGILHAGFSQARISSFVATISLVITTYFWTYSRNLFDGVLCSTLLMLSFFLILKYRKQGNFFYLVYCFVCLGFALITRASMILAILVSFAYLVSIYRSSLAIRIKEISLALVTLLPFIGWQFWYNHLRTGVFYKSPVQSVAYASNNGLDGNLFIGLQGLLLSPGKSIFVYAPLLVLSIFLFKKFYREHQKEAIYLLALSVLWFLLHAKLRSWYGAAGWGPRHFITILPILFLPLAVNLNYVLRTTTLKISAVFLASFGFILALCSIISNWHFRMVYAAERDMNTDDIFVWGLWNSQSGDMLKGALMNIVRILTNAPIIRIKDTYSEANEYASSTINVWPNSLLFAGIPWYVVVLLVTPIFVLMYWSLQNIFSSEP